VEYGGWERPSTSYLFRDFAKVNLSLAKQKNEGKDFMESFGKLKKQPQILF
jgi:hypothetical protein